MGEPSGGKVEDASYTIGLKRIYEPADPGDGYRILVDRLWARGVTKEQAAIDEWMKDIAPSPALRKWFGHLPERFAAFKERYTLELEENPECAGLAEAIRERALNQRVTLVYAAKDPVHNHAKVLYEWLNSR
ncbi:DUF488 domain-containing protein [Paenibacillus silagei]|uniref:Uncharacterized protein YeaO (DUF488 family) n=1 Tax=Paenibacillus silagei TaxID=1670801 RepID=A0ABS4NVB4_9BACL|nr:DUF488 domain-containing protein [Paenibacillus silagei]MBP2113232.1 uncharacterized protein YeaO (DUF488 family) [Paenibacillus silagei]